MNREGLKKLVEKVNSGGGSGGDAYTKAETDALLLEKADADDVYTKTEVDTELADKADISDVYTKTEVDTELADKQDVLTAGTGIDITNNVISATGGVGWELYDTTQHNFYDLFTIGDTKLTANKNIIVYRILSSNNHVLVFNIVKGFEFTTLSASVGGFSISNPNELNSSNYYINKTKVTNNKISMRYDRAAFTTDGTSITITTSEVQANDRNMSDFKIYTKD